jgi:hypothetical protein
MHLLIPPIVGRAVDVQWTEGYLYIAAEHGGVRPMM